MQVPEEPLNRPPQPAPAVAELADALKALAVFAIIPLGLALVGLINAAWIPTLTVDAAQVAGKHPLVGMVSTMGVLLWATAATLCTLAACLLREAGQRDARFFAASAALTGYLMLDDWLQIHETLAPRYVGVPEIAMIGLLAAAMLAYLWAFHERLRRDPGRARLAVALSCLGLSVVIDTAAQWAFGDLGHWEYLFEDGFKWLGIAAWLTFFWRAAGQALQVRRPS